MFEYINFYASIVISSEDILGHFYKISQYISLKLFQSTFFQDGFGSFSDNLLHLSTYLLVACDHFWQLFMTFLDNDSIFLDNLPYIYSKLALLVFTQSSTRCNCAFIRQELGTFCLG